MVLAKQMILSAKENGAGMVKSQLYNAEDDRGKPNYDLIKKAELTFDQAKELFDYGAKIGMEVFFSVFGAQYVVWCEKIGVKRYKIASPVGKDFPLLLKIFLTGKPLIWSLPNGQITSCEYLSLPHSTPMSYLYCVPDYPAKFTQFDRVRFNMRDSQEYYNGISDHTIGIDVAKIALARGAGIIEKHFILDRNSPAPDAPWSMTPAELAELVRWDKLVQECL